MCLLLPIRPGTGNEEGTLTPKKKEKVDEKDNHDEEEGDEDEDILRSPTKATSWLQSMGLDRTEFPSLEPSRVKLYPFEKSILSYPVMLHLVILEGTIFRAIP